RSPPRPDDFRAPRATSTARDEVSPASDSAGFLAARRWLTDRQLAIHGSQELAVMSGLVDSDLYRQHRAEILARWDDAARAHPLTSGASRDALRAGMAAWLDGAADPLDGAGELLELEQVIAAYALLRAAIAEVIGSTDRAAPAIDDTIMQFAARRASQHARFLADASAALASSLDYDATLERVAQLAVPLLADWCVVDLVDESTHELRRVSVAHRDPALRHLAHEWALRYPPATSRGVAEVVRTRQLELVPEVPDAL